MHLTIYEFHKYVESLINMRRKLHVIVMKYFILDVLDMYVD